MAEKCGFFNSVSRDRRYKAEDWAEYFATFISNGVFPKPAAGLMATAPSNGEMAVYLRPGKAYINGYRYENTGDLLLPLALANAALPRIDRVVIRWNRTARNIAARVIQGTATLNPVAPAIQRDTDAYDLCVADIRVPAGATTVAAVNITDTRYDDALCGIVGWMVEDVDTTGLFEQFRAAFEVLFGKMETDIAVVKQESIGQATSASMEIVREFVDEATITVDKAAASANAAADRAISAASNLSLSAGVMTLAADGWVPSGAVYMQNLHAAGASAVSVITLSYAPEPGGATENKVAFETAGIWMTEQEDEEITFACTLLPDMDISINLTYGQEVT